jgi:hypothetical protein
MRDYQRPLLLDYRYIADAQDYYSEHRYTPVAVPWVIGDEAYSATIPDGVARYETLGGFLVGSAEQSFIQMLLDGVEPLGRMQAASPCFRDEEHDELHSPYFFKLELFDNTLPMDTKSVLSVLDDARGFMERYLPTKLVQEGPTSWDIVSAHSGVELGSYGVRKVAEHSWIYGTGVALPRLQQAVGSLK